MWSRATNRFGGVESLPGTKDLMFLAILKMEGKMAKDIEIKYIPSDPEYEEKDVLDGALKNLLIIAIVMVIVNIIVLFG